MSRRTARKAAEDLSACLAFLGRLPVPRGLAPHGPLDLTRAAWAVPIAGLVLGLLGAAALAGAAWLGASPFLAGSLAVLALVLGTGALHEDGLADTADGLGGSSPERRLEIMRDSRVGTFGVLAVVFSVLLRVAALTSIAGERGAIAAALALAGAAALSRAAALWPLYALPPARPDGLGAAAGRLPARAIAQALAIGAAFALLLAWPAGLGPALGALLAAAGAAFALTVAASRSFGGQTGDVAGASQQGAEIAFLTVLATLA